MEADKNPVNPESIPLSSLGKKIDIYRWRQILIVLYRALEILNLQVRSFHFLITVDYSNLTGEVNLSGKIGSDGRGPEDYTPHLTLCKRRYGENICNIRKKAILTFDLKGGLPWLFIIWISIP